MNLCRGKSRRVPLEQGMGLLMSASCSLPLSWEGADWPATEEKRGLSSRLGKAKAPVARAGEVAWRRRLGVRPPGPGGRKALWVGASGPFTAEQQSDSPPLELRSGPENAASREGRQTARAGVPVAPSCSDERQRESWREGREGSSFCASAARPGGGRGPFYRAAARPLVWL